MTRKHTCDELGVCQRHPECNQFCFGACEPTSKENYPFAPGVIEGREPEPKGTWFIDLVAATIAVGAVAAVVGFATGYLDLPGWLL